MQHEKHMLLELLSRFNFKGYAFCATTNGDAFFIIYRDFGILGRCT